MEKAKSDLEIELAEVTSSLVKVRDSDYFWFLSS